MMEVVVDSTLRRVSSRKPAKTRWDGEFLLAMPDRFSRLVVLNRTAGSVWNLCDGARTIAEIIAELRQMYPHVEEDRITFDVVKTLRDLEGRNLLKVGRGR